jgi:uncharacterized protein (DUF2141 family)
MLTLASIGLLNFVNAQTNECTVQITGLKSNTGKCLLYLYKDKKGFPTDAKTAIATTTVVIKDSKATAVFKGITAGEYAISVVHDENDNGKLDTNFLGIPKEGIGTSNNAKSTLGPPSFEDSRFTMGNKSNSITINIKYL